MERENLVTKTICTALVVENMSKLLLVCALFVAYTIATNAWQDTYVPCTTTTPVRIHYSLSLTLIRPLLELDGLTVYLLVISIYILKLIVRILGENRLRLIIHPMFSINILATIANWMGQSVNYTPQCRIGEVWVNQALKKDAEVESRTTYTTCPYSIGKVCCPSPKSCHSGSTIATTCY